MSLHLLSESMQWYVKTMRHDDPSRHSSRTYLGLIAAERIGAETVTYVSNIYKYYIAYRLILDARAEKERAIEKMKGEGKKVP